MFGVEHTLHNTWSLIRRRGGVPACSQGPDLSRVQLQRSVDDSRKIPAEQRASGPKRDIILTMDESCTILGSVPKRGRFRTAKSVIFMGAVKGSRMRVNIRGH